MQVKSAVATSGSSVAITYPAAQTAGNLNVVAVMWGDTTSAVSSVTDSKGNTYALAVGPTKVTRTDFSDLLRQEHRRRQ